MSELLNCPFCGGEAQIVGDDRYGFCVVCSASDCTAALGESYDRDAMPDHQFRAPDDAITAWNTRPAPSEAEVEAAAKRMHEADKESGYANDWSWDEVGDTYRSHYIRRAEAALGVRK